MPLASSPWLFTSRWLRAARLSGKALLTGDDSVAGHSSVRVRGALFACTLQGGRVVLNSPGGSGGASSTTAARPFATCATRATPITSPWLIHWTERHNYTDYFAWRTERGFTATFEAMLTQPLVIHD